MCWSSLSVPRAEPPMRGRFSSVLLAIFVATGVAVAAERQPMVSLRETVAVTALHDLKDSRDLRIAGRVQAGAPARTVWLRVTDGTGRSATAWATVNEGAFTAAYPRDFDDAPALRSSVYFIDVATRVDAPPAERAEAAVVVFDSRATRVPPATTATCRS